MLEGVFIIIIYYYVLKDLLVQSLAAEVVALEEKVLQTRSREIRLEKGAARMQEGVQQAEKQLQASRRDRASLQTTIDMLQVRQITVWGPRGGGAVRGFGAGAAHRAGVGGGPGWGGARGCAGLDTRNITEPCTTNASFLALIIVASRISKHCILCCKQAAVIHSVCVFSTLIIICYHLRYPIHPYAPGRFHYTVSPQCEVTVVSPPLPVLLLLLLFLFCFFLLLCA